jgi:hypothetical protein
LFFFIPVIDMAALARRLLIKRPQVKKIAIATWQRLDPMQMTRQDDERVDL